MAPGGSEHGTINMDLAGLLWNLVRKHKLGGIFYGPRRYGLRPSIEPGHRSRLMWRS